MPCVCSVIYHRGSQTVIGISVTHLSAPCVSPLCSYHILISSVLYYWTDTWQHVSFSLSLWVPGGKDFSDMGLYSV